MQIRKSRHFHLFGTNRTFDDIGPSAIRAFWCVAAHETMAGMALHVVRFFVHFDFAEQRVRPEVPQLLYFAVIEPDPPATPGTPGLLQGAAPPVAWWLGRSAPAGSLSASPRLVFVVQPLPDSIRAFQSPAKRPTAAWSRLLTVPSGRESISAISLYAKSWK